MSNISGKMSLVSRGLRYKMILAFTLMSLIPLLVCIWLITAYIFPNIDLFFGLSLGNISLILVIAIAISLLGLYVTKEMLDPVIKIANNASDIAKGNPPYTVIDIKTNDEIGELSRSLNVITQKIKDNMNELKEYGNKAKEINIDIDKKVFALSSLLQIGNLISFLTDLPTIFSVILEKISSVTKNSACFVMLMEEDGNEFKVFSVYNIENNRLISLKIKEDDVTPSIKVFDKYNTAKTRELNYFTDTLKCKNILTLPIIVSGKQYGILGVCNNADDFIFEEDDKEIFKIFTKQASIAVANSFLVNKTRSLTLIDDVTGLYNKSYITARLDEEIKRSSLSQRPCGFILIDIDEFKAFRRKYGEMRSEFLLKSLGEIIKCVMTEIDKVGRMEQDVFGIILPEKNKKQAAAIAEDIRKNVEDKLTKTLRVAEAMTISAGVSENPIDGFNATELINKAEKLLGEAKTSGKNKVCA